MATTNPAFLAFLPADSDVLAALEGVRQDGQVTNDRDWPLRVAADRVPVTRTRPGRG